MMMLMMMMTIMTIIFQIIKMLVLHPLRNQDLSSERVLRVFLWISLRAPIC